MGRFQFTESRGFCVPMLQSYYFIYALLIFSILYSCIVVVTIIYGPVALLTITLYFKRAERRSGTNVFNSKENIFYNYMYSSKKREVIGALVLTNAISFLPSLGVLIAGPFVYIKIPDEVYTTIFIFLLLATVGNPLAQVLFREDIKMVFKNLYSTLAGKCSHYKAANELNIDS